jgi:F-type H+-transporting ATPase subunit delta
MSSLTTLARPYAKAAFELAMGEQALAQWDDMLNMASSIVSDESMAKLLESPDESMAKLLESPDVSNAQAANIITDAAGDAFNSRFRDFINVLAFNGRLPLLPHITDLYRQLREEAEKRLSVRVVSAIALDEDQAGRIG